MLDDAYSATETGPWASWISALYLLCGSIVLMLAMPYFNVDLTALFLPHVLFGVILLYDQRIRVTYCPLQSVFYFETTWLFGFLKAERKCFESETLTFNSVTLGDLPGKAVTIYTPGGAVCVRVYDETLVDVIAAMLAKRKE